MSVKADILFTVGYRSHGIDEDGGELHEVAIIDEESNETMVNFPILGPLDADRKARISDLLFKIMRECLGKSAPGLQAVRVAGSGKDKS